MFEQNQLGIYVPDAENFEEIFSPKGSPVKVNHNNIFNFNEGLPGLNNKAHDSRNMPSTDF